MSEAHKRIREELEGAVLAFAEQPRAPEKHQTYIIVAPFGSGKSTLLNYLRCFSICNNIPAIKINLSELVIFLKNKNEEIYEDQLPNYIYKFFEEKRKELLKTGNYEFESCSVDRNVVKRALQRSDVGILLIDEIEETYDELKKIVKATTTPFRGLYDAVWQGESKILPILAFGPTSAYKEATSLSGSWRVQIRSLPIVYPSKIDLPNADPHIKNLVWWIGKGRIGHTQSIAKTIAGLGRFDIQGIKEVLENFKGREVVEGTPYIDTRQKERLVRTSQDPEDIELLEITSIKIGPIPVAELKNLNKNKLIYTKKQYFVVSKKLIEIEKVISNIENAISSILATTSTSKNIVNYEFARDLIRSVIESWSDHQYLIYDRAALTELLDLVKYMAIELYMPELFGILSKLNLDAVFDNLDKEALIMDQFYVALRPSILAKIYPIILLNPLIGSSRKLDYDKLFNFIQNLDSTEVFILSDIFMKLLKIFYENLDVQILILPERLFYDDKTRRDVIRKWIHSNERKIVIIGLSRDEIKIDEPWQRLKNLGILDIEFAYDKMMWFIAGVLYDIKERGYPRDPEKLKEWINTLDELERNILQQYITALEKLIEQSLNKTQKTQLVNLDVIREAQELDRYDYQVGRGHYKYLWLLSISSETTKNIIKDSINYLKEIEEEFKKL
ncbi:MAG: ATP-binding protein, partial [Infirmifilum sp.]